LPVQLPRLRIAEELERGQAALEAALEQRVCEQLAGREPLRGRIDAALEEVPRPAVLECEVDGNRLAVESEEAEAQAPALRRPRGDIAVERAGLRLREDCSAALVLPAR